MKANAIDVNLWGSIFSRFIQDQYLKQETCYYFNVRFPDGEGALHIPAEDLFKRDYYTDDIWGKWSLHPQKYTKLVLRPEYHDCKVIDLLKDDIDIKDFIYLLGAYNTYIPHEAAFKLIFDYLSKKEQWCIL